MLKKKLIGIALMFFLINMIQTCSFATTEGVITGETVKLRDGASLEAGLVMLLSVDDEVQVLGKEGEWYQVTFEGNTGYVYQDYIEVQGELEEPEQKPEETVEQEMAPELNEGEKEINDEQDMVATQNITAQEVSVRLLPVIYLESIQNLPAGTSVEILEERNGWAYIQTEEITGWVRRDKIVEKEIEKQEEEAPKEEQQPQEKPIKKVGYVNVDTVNVRKEPDIASEVVENASKNQKVVIESEENNWSKVTINGKTGYIASKYLSDSPVEVTNRSATTSRLDEKRETEISQTEESKVEGQEIVSYAKTFLGYPYVTGGTSPNGFDCSGFTQYIYAHFGYLLNRTASAQTQNGVAVSKSDLQVGDLVFFSQGSKAIGHVGIYIGGNEFIHASNPNDGVKITSLSNSYYVARYVTARRVI